MKKHHQLDNFDLAKEMEDFFIFRAREIESRRRGDPWIDTKC